VPKSHKITFILHLANIRKPRQIDWWKKRLQQKETKQTISNVQALLQLIKIQRRHHIFSVNLHLQANLRILRIPNNWLPIKIEPVFIILLCICPTTLRLIDALKRKDLGRIRFMISYFSLGIRGYKVMSLWWKDWKENDDDYKFILCTIVYQWFIGWQLIWSISYFILILQLRWDKITKLKRCSINGRQSMQVYIYLWRRSHLWIQSEVERAFDRTVHLESIGWS